ncbi:MAG: uracil-DNA glycosylase [Candidatus Nanohaloarchaea archaeon]
MREKYEEFFESLNGEHFDEDLFVPAVGPEDASVAMVGEAPGANEVKEGEPFVGRAGSRMDEVLEKIGVERKGVYITNLVKIRPPDNRDPRSDEIEAWRPLLEQELAEVDPDTVVTLGNFASRELIDTNKGISSIHGKVYHINSWKVIPVYHPAATLYDRSKMPELEEDLKKAFGKKETGQKSLKDL